MRPRSYLLSALILIFSARAVSAELIEYSFTGTIDSNTIASGALSSIDVAEPLSGVFRYEGTTPATPSAGLALQFFHPEGFLGVTFTVGEHTLQGDVNAGEDGRFRGFILDDFPIAPADTLSFEQPGLPVDGELDPIIRAEFSGPSSAMSDPEQLPSSIDLGDWTTAVVRFGTVSQRLTGFIDHLSLVETPQGDYNSDAAVDHLDADLLSGAMADPSPDLDLYDENDDGFVNWDDRLIWIHDRAMTWVGDSNLDGEFNSGDFVDIFVAGEYQTGNTAGWAEGDWNGDRLFDSGDFVVAFTDGGYNHGLRPAAQAIPEPTALSLFLLSAGLVMLRRRELAAV